VTSKVVVFVSASVDPKDREVVQWFSNIIQELEMEPIFAIHHPEPRLPLKKVKNLIQKSHVLVAILTRRSKVEGKDLWKAPEWIQHEIAFAESYEIPIAIFAEQGVDVKQGIVPWITEYIIFDRNNISSYEGKVRKYLKTLKECALKKLPLEEREEISSTIVEEEEESIFDRIFIDIGKSILKRKYKRLDVSLRRFYIFLALISIVPAYLIYDYYWGIKIFGNWGVLTSFVVLAITVGIIYLAEATRCRKCKSYFSWRESPIRVSDIKKFEVIPKGKRLKKYVCEVCGYTRYKFVRQEE